MSEAPTKRVAIPLWPISAFRWPFGKLGAQAVWIVAPFALQQFARLVTNIALTHLLAPEMFGLMLLVNTLRTGAELLSDIGIGQSVVRHPNGADRDFLDVAWTLQLLRGIVLTVGVVLAAYPIAHIYHTPSLFPILVVVSSVFLLTGLLSPGLFLLQRNLQLHRRALFDVTYAVFQAVFTIGLARFMPSIWALVWGLVGSTAFSTAMSYTVGLSHRPRFSLHAKYVSEILHFGKWVFLATAVYFAATSVDKLYFTAALPLSMAGIYNVARTFSDMVGLLSQRVGAFLVFPKVAALVDRGGAQSGVFRRKRFIILCVIIAGLAIATACSDQFVLIVYDARYRAAAFLLPILLLGSVFSVLATFGEATLLGCGRPAPIALGNAVKFIVLAAGLPVTMNHGSFFGALLVLIFAEIVRWVWLASALQQQRLSSMIDDLGLIVLFVGGVVATKVLLSLVGVVPSLPAWWAIGSAIHG